jgi:hypothetical protein
MDSLSEGNYAEENLKRGKFYPGGIFNGFSLKKGFKGFFFNVTNLIVASHHQRDDLHVNTALIILPETD